MSDHDDDQQSDFDAIIGIEFSDEQTNLEVISTLMDRVADLENRIAFYEDAARAARHARRKLIKATDQGTAVEAMNTLRGALRAIHATTKITKKTQG